MHCFSLVYLQMSPCQSPLIKILKSCIAYPTVKLSHSVACLWLLDHSKVIVVDLLSKHKLRVNMTLLFSFGLFSLISIHISFMRRNTIQLTHQNLLSPSFSWLLYVGGKLEFKIKNTINSVYYYLLTTIESENLIHSHPSINNCLSHPSAMLRREYLRINKNHL